MPTKAIHSIQQQLYEIKNYKQSRHVRNLCAISSEAVNRNIVSTNG